MNSTDQHNPSFLQRHQMNAGKAAISTACVPLSFSTRPPAHQVKENICKEGFIVDKDDNSLTRSNAYMLDLFQRAGMSVQ